MQFIFILIVIGVIISAVKRAKQAEGQRNQQNQPGTYNATTGSFNMPDNPSAPAAGQGSYTPTIRPLNPAPARYDTQTGRPLSQPYTTQPAAQRRQAYNPTVDNHLCEDGAHPLESDASYAATLFEMESGYQRYQPVPMRASAGQYRRMDLRRLSADEIRKKQEELKDLRDAGIITSLEYNQKMQEYATGY